MPWCAGNIEHQLITFEFKTGGSALADILTCSSVRALSRGSASLDSRVILKWYLDGYLHNVYRERLGYPAVALGARHACSQCDDSLPLPRHHVRVWIVEWLELWNLHIIQ